jgi:hypothetical protein
LEGGNDRAGVVAVRAVAIVAEPTHQLGPSLRGAPRIPARLGGWPGEGEPRNEIFCSGSITERIAPFKM